MKKTLIPLVVVLALAGCGSHTTSSGEDAGVARCRQIAANLAGGTGAKVPTKGQIDAVRDDFSRSKYDDLKAAGINYADAAEALFYGTGSNRGNLLDAMQRQALLGTACEQHGAPPPVPTAPSDMPIPEAPPTMEYVPMPTS